MIITRPAVLAALLGIAAASCGSSAAAPDGGPAGDASDASGASDAGGASDASGDRAASETAADGPRDAALDGRCPSDVFFGHPCDKASDECVAEVPTGGVTKYYCVSCGSPLPMPDASPEPLMPRWQTILDCPP